jgi:hypothetical protein
MEEGESGTQPTFFGNPFEVDVEEQTDESHEEYAETEDSEEVDKEANDIFKATTRLSSGRKNKKLEEKERATPIKPITSFSKKRQSIHRWSMNNNAQLIKPKV